MKKRKNSNYQKSKTGNPLLRQYHKLNNATTERLKGLKNIIFNAATASINFVWLYLLEVYKEKLNMNIITYVDIAKMIEVLNTDIREKKSIVHVYNYLVRRYNEGELEGFLTVEKVKEIAPMYSDYFENYSITDDNDA